jgi:uncharacterized repeat protein (TIGR03899 family)
MDKNQGNIVVKTEPSILNSVNDNVTIKDDKKIKTTNSVINSSTQFQLLSLVKHFSLDAGALSAAESGEKHIELPIQDRALRRERLSLLRKQQNIEAITYKALGYCSNDEVADRTDRDWFNSFINLAEDVSNNTMQGLWAKILAGEIAQPGSYALKTLKVFRNMSITDAKLLAKLCSLAVKDASRKNMRIISGCSQQPGLLNSFDKKRQQSINLSHFGLNHSELLSLADSHIIFTQESESSIFLKGGNFNFSYNGLNLPLVAKKSNCLLSFYKFTATGMELAHLIADSPNDEYFVHLKQQLSHHFSISS